MPGENAVLVYSDDGTPYCIPTDQMAQFRVTGDELTALQRDAAKPVDAEAGESPSKLTAYHLEDVGPRPIPDWPIGCLP
jgi:hypothetical protein